MPKIKVQQAEVKEITVNRSTVAERSEIKESKEV